MLFHPAEVLFGEDDPGYRSTLVESGVPPPSLDTVPRTVRTPSSSGGTHSRGGHSGGPSRFMQAPQWQQQQQQQHLPPPPPPPPELLARMIVQVQNPRGSTFDKQLTSADWLRMMSDRDDVRGRQTDQRLCDPRLLQSINAGETPLASLPPAQIDAARRAVHPYAALEARCSLGTLAAVELGHVDFLLRPVLGLLQQQPGSALRYVVQGSNGGAYADYIQWRASTVPGAPRPSGWCFAPGAVGPKAAGLEVVEGGADPLDLPAMDGFVRRVRGDDSGRDGVDLVVADGVDAHAGPSASLEKQLYAVVMAQAALALQVLRVGGSFVFRAVEATTPLSAEILFLIQACFEGTAVVRSFASCPTGAERFVVCRGLVAGAGGVVPHLLAALARIRDGQFKLAHLVSWTRVSAERPFVDMVCKANVSVAQAQIDALTAVATHAQQQQKQQHVAAGNSFSDTQVDLASQCLRLWCLPAAGAA